MPKSLGSLFSCVALAGLLGSTELSSLPNTVQKRQATDSTSPDASLRAQIRSPYRTA
ncbi:hypothetical protein PF007_g5360 [Phytophthora fragariae]|uniref:RxLR effector protein n=1 Tax=Phytophthora fragariae TaxID=53985 RepID=A0A6A3T2V0_9STRA|nr:hypothetical protein PF007_g5360 [Phytophthora fragariae]